MSKELSLLKISDPESRTTRLSLCCAVTESSSHTPPHSNHFQVSHGGNHYEDDEPQIIHTKDSGSQTDSNLGININNNNNNEFMIKLMMSKTMYRICDFV